MGAFEYRQAQEIRDCLRFTDAWNRRVDIEGFPVCHIDDIIASKAATNR